jgi:hypothetical protein
MKFAKVTVCRLNEALMKSSTYLYDAAPSLYESVHRHFKTCAFTAIVAVACLAMAQPVEAKIVYTPVNIGIGPDQYYNLDLNHDGVTDVVILNKFINGRPCPTGSYVAELPASGNGVVGTPPGALNQGTEIGPDQQFYEGSGTMASVYTHRQCGTFASGPWLNVAKRYLGLSVQLNGQTYFGWARLTVRLNHVSFAVTLTGYAYESIAGKSILAGQTIGAQDDPVNPEDSGASASMNNLVLGTLQTVSLSGRAFGTQRVSPSGWKELPLEGNGSLVDVFSRHGG